MATQVTDVEVKRCFGGVVRKMSHPAPSLAGLTHTFVVFTPESCQGKPSPACIWLSGLTCTEANFTEKAGAFRKASQEGVVLVIPDIFPRGGGVHTEGDVSKLFAGFYVNAETPNWSTHHRMYDYITKDLRETVSAHCGVDLDRVSIFGHSMGGHGALTLALKNPTMFKSCSAFAPICHPVDCAWGELALGTLIGSDKEAWKAHDAVELLKSYSGPDLHLKADFGTSDPFLANQLKPELLRDVCKERSISLELGMQEGYDHSYYFISTFIDEHISHHAKYLKA